VQTGRTLSKLPVGWRQVDTQKEDGAFPLFIASW
jgi:hypothetical protein